MKIKKLHRWDISPREAIAVQKELRARYFKTAPLDFSRIRVVAGADAAYLSTEGRALAVVVTFDYPSLARLETVHALVPVGFPYVPGLLSWREGPAVIAAFEKLARSPDAVIFDGQGLAHPRRFGIASHMGVLLGVPTVGAAKTVLVGRYEEPGPARGGVTPLLDKGEEIGAVVRTKTGIQPVFVSIGQAVTLSDAVRLVLDCSKGYRLPEPTRQAHLEANRLRLKYKPVSQPRPWE